MGMPKIENIHITGMVEDTAHKLCEFAIRLEVAKALRSTKTLALPLMIISVHEKPKLGPEVVTQHLLQIL